MSSDNEIALKNLENNKVDCDTYISEINRVNKKFLESIYSLEITNNKVDTLND